MNTPKVSILSKSFKYVNSANTDISETFKRIRAEQSKRSNQEKNVCEIRAKQKNK